MQAGAGQVGVEPKLHVQRVERNAIEALKAIGESTPPVSTSTQQDICGQRNRMTVIDAGIQRARRWRFQDWTAMAMTRQRSHDSRLISSIRSRTEMTSDVACARKPCRKYSSMSGSNS